jgi:SAM-dependent methyltransferase
LALPVSPHYLSDRGEHYQKRAGSVAFYRRQQIELYFRGHTTGEDVVLDFGCNDGLFLASLEAKRRIGVEVNPAARRQLVADDIEVHADASAIEDGVVDVAISNHCLEHTLTPFETLREIYRVLKPGGKLVLVLPFDDWRGNANDRW